MKNANIFLLTLAIFLNYSLAQAESELPKEGTETLEEIQILPLTEVSVDEVEEETEAEEEDEDEDEDDC